MAQVTLWLEGREVLDRLAPLYAALSGPVSQGAIARILRGEPAAHAVHPAMSDLPIGLWVSSLVLDLGGRPSDCEASKRLLAAGLLAAVPTAITGLAEWRGLSRRDSRIGSLHAVLNLASLALYAGSLAARRGGRHSTGVVLSLGGAGLTSAAGYLGGHLTVARNAGTRDPAYATS
jgi:uncharacterized membrane protein